MAKSTANGRSNILTRFAPLVVVGHLLQIAAVSFAAGIEWRKSGASILFAGVAIILAAMASRWAPHRRLLWKRIALVVLFGWTINFMINAYVQSSYGVPINSPHMIEVVGNTVINEVGNYILHAGVQLLVAVLVFALLMYETSRVLEAATAYEADLGTRRPVRGDTRSWLWTSRAMLGLLLFLAVGIHAHPVLRRENPIMFWVHLRGLYTYWQNRVANFSADRAKSVETLATWTPKLGPQGPRTVVLVLGESVNRWNWQLYGYGRPTTPRLMEVRDDLVVFADAISAAPATMGSVIYMMTSAELGSATPWWQAPSVMLLAKAAGYKLFWLTNQSDRAISAMLAADADVQVRLNKGGMRGDASLDEKLIEPLEQALADPAPHKFIVVHMLGAHPHYDMRYPARFKMFGDTTDVVSADMGRRLFYVRWARDQYDNAMLYQDHIVREVLDRVRSQTGSGARSMMFVSDHGQEVGHLSNKFGHAPTLESGYVVPMVLWTNEPLKVPKAELEQRPYQTDRLDWTLLRLLGVSTPFSKPENDILDPAFKASKRTIGGAPYKPGKPN